jgi:hypothetical protein
LDKAAKPDRVEPLAELERIRALPLRRKPGADYTTAERLIREDRDRS